MKRKMILGCVYFLQDNYSKAVKIGKTTNLKRRMNELKNLPYGATVLSTFPSYQYDNLEKMLHKFYKSKRLNGEWFDLKEIDIQQILKRNLSNEIKEMIVNEENNFEKFIERQDKYYEEEINKQLARMSWS